MGPDIETDLPRAIQSSWSLQFHKAVAVSGSVAIVTPGLPARVGAGTGGS